MSASSTAAASSSVIDKVEQYTMGPKASDFTKDELRLIDIDALQRNYLKITFKSYSDEVYLALRDITACQYALPMRYLKPVPSSYSYISQKSQIFGKERDIKNASVTIEPLNPDIFNLISYTTINQSMPLGTVVTIDVETEYDTREDGTEPERKFIWSSNLKTSDDIQQKIKAENPNSITTKPWIDKCHYCAIDVGSRLVAKFEVATVDTEIIKSFSLFGFARADDDKTFTIWTYKCFNVLPADVLKLVQTMKPIQNDETDITVAASTVKIIDEILSKLK